MARSQITFNKKEREKKKLQKRKEKEARREEKREAESKGGLENMMAYVDEFGNITDTPPDPAAKSKVNAKDIEIGVPKQEKEDLSGERRGRVSFFNEGKGYGFISQDGVQDRFFVHANNATSALQEGDKVTFEVEEGPKGLMAVRVKVLK